MIIKCKMCGGDIQFNPGDTNGQCDHCGCTTTFPKLPDEQRANLFNRANHFRRQCEFDKAMATYEHILEEDDAYDQGTGKKRNSWWLRTPGIRYDTAVSINYYGGIDYHYYVTEVKVFFADPLWR